jgi:hypothetical protein
MRMPASFATSSAIGRASGRGSERSQSLAWSCAARIFAAALCVRHREFAHYDLQDVVAPAPSPYAEAPE